jgi:hypothetical protein
MFDCTAGEALAGGAPALAVLVLSFFLACKADQAAKPHGGMPVQHRSTLRARHCDGVRHGKYDHKGFE